MSTHTPTPWVFWPNDKGGWMIEARDAVICQRNDWDHRAAESVANGRLFFAAPDMLAALRDIEFIVDGKEDADDGIPNDAMKIMSVLKTALRKAGCV